MNIKYGTRNTRIGEQSLDPQDLNRIIAADEFAQGSFLRWVKMRLACQQCRQVHNWTERDRLCSRVAEHRSTSP